MLTSVRMAASTVLVSNGYIKGKVAFRLVSLLFRTAAALAGCLRRRILVMLNGVQGQHHLISYDYYYPLLRMTIGVLGFWGDRKSVV